MNRIYVSVRRETKHRSFYPALLVLCCCFAFILFSLAIRNHNNTLTEELIVKLSKSREVAETNKRLKYEYAGITHARYLQFKAKERLGLQKPKEEEIYVLR